MSVNQRTLNDVVLAYIEAWSTPDEAVRRELLEKSLADDASYTDPAYEVRGKEEIASHIGRSLSGEAYGGRSWGPDPDKQRGRPAPRVVSLLLGDGRFTGPAAIGGYGLRGAGRRRTPPAHQWLLRSISADTGELARTPGVAQRAILLSNTRKAGAATSWFPLALFTKVRGIGILGSSYPECCISAPNAPEISLSRAPLRPGPLELVTPMDRYTELWMLAYCKH